MQRRFRCQALYNVAAIALDLRREDTESAGCCCMLLHLVSIGVLINITCQEECRTIFGLLDTGTLW